MSEPEALDERVRVRVVISGIVQGVWFRDSCRQEAQFRGLTGWVRNNRDGTVEAAFEGPRAGVEAAVAWCRIGPPRAHVTGIKATPESPAGDARFRVL